jgi:hypothetical protein
MTNTGSTPIHGLLVKEVIPKDIIPPTKSSEFVIKKSSGEILVDNYKIKITPPDIDASVPHTVEILINIGEHLREHLLDVNESLEIYYPLSVFSPDYRTMYDFNTKITSYLSKYQDLTGSTVDSFYYTTHTQVKEKTPTLRFGRDRQNLVIDKCIYPGKNTDEFKINISVENISDMNLRNITIMDVFPKFFELVSSNIEYKLEDFVNRDEFWITFYLQKLLPKEKIDIHYKLKNLTDQEIDYSEIEPFIFS